MSETGVTAVHEQSDAFMSALIKCCTVHHPVQHWFISYSVFSLTSRETKKSTHNFKLFFFFIKLVLTQMTHVFPTIFTSNNDLLSYLCVVFFGLAQRHDFVHRSSDLRTSRRCDSKYAGTCVAGGSLVWFALPNPIQMTRHCQTFQR